LRGPVGADRKRGRCGSGIEITADPEPLISILAEERRATTSLCATWRRPRLPASIRDTRHCFAWTADLNVAAHRAKHTSLLVHGTWARNDSWWQPGGSLHAYLLPTILPDLYAGADRFDWSGGYSDAAD
jgi:hypothetical protein